MFQKKTVRTMNQKKVNRITTQEEKDYIKETREKYKRGELRDKMEKVSKEQKGEGEDFLSYLQEDENKSELNCIGFPHNDPYGLGEAFWKIFTKPKV